MRRVVGILLALAVLGTSARAENSFTINGFGFWVDENVFGSEFGDLSFEHVWFVIEKPTSEQTRVVMILAPQGPPKQVHDLRVHRLHPFSRLPWIEELVVGKFIPPMGREWSEVRIDRVGTVRYSGLSDSLVARDNGLQFKVRTGSFSGSCALFLGDRIGGYVGERDNTHRHFYFRGRYDLPYEVVLGASYRWSTLDRRPWALELTRQNKQSLYAFELVRVERLTQWYALVERDVLRETPILGGRLRAIMRFEKLRYGERMALGCGFFPFPGLTVKVNCVAEWFAERTNKLLTQGIIYF